MLWQRLRRVGLILVLLLGGIAAVPHAVSVTATSYVPDVPRTTIAEPEPPEPADPSSPISDPFPATPTMTDTVLAVVRDLAELPHPLTPPDGAAPQQVPEMPDSDRLASHRVYLPLTVRPRYTPNDPPPPPAPADVAVTLWPTPSIRVLRDGTLSYEVRIANHGRGTAAGVRVVLPYPRQQVTLTNATFASGSGDWVSAVTADSITVSFGPLAAGARRAGTLTYRVSAGLANEAVISVRATDTWSDDRDGGRGATNWAPVLVGAGNAHSAYLWMAVNPASGKAGTTHQFFTDRFIPGEGVITWLNTPTGVRPLNLRAVADSSGRVWLNLSSAGLTPGTYSLVVYGARSNLTAVAGFTVDL